MTLFRIHKDADAPFDKYTEETTELIEEWYLNGRTSVSINEILKKCWEEDTWLQCDCHPDYTPIMHVRRKGNSYFIVRMSRYGMHTPECVFSQKPFSDQHNQLSAHSKSRETKLKDIFYDLIYQAELNQMPLHARGYGRPLNIQYQYLKEAAPGVLGDAYSDYSDLFITHPNGLTACRKQLENFSIKHPNDILPNGYLFMMADTVFERNITLVSKGKKYEINCLGECFLESSDYKGPWIGLVSLTMDKKTKSILAKDGVFVPAMRKSLLCPLRDDDQWTLKVLEPIKEIAAEQNKRLICTRHLPNDDKYHHGVRFNVRCGTHAVDIAIIHTDEGRSDLPKSCLYHFQPQDLSQDHSEQYLLGYIKQRLHLA